jgi:hypothetical protein
LSGFWPAPRNVEVFNGPGEFLGGHRIDHQA